MKAKESEKQPSSLEALRKVIKEVWVHEISSFLALIAGFLPIFQVSKFRTFYVDLLLNI